MPYRWTMLAKVARCPTACIEGTTVTTKSSVLLIGPTITWLMRKPRVPSAAFRLAASHSFRRSNSTARHATFECVSLRE